jgi:hypothetical protein
MLSLVPMSGKRVGLNTKVKPEIKAIVEHYAAKEHRSLNNLAEVLLEWAVEQLKRTGSTIALLETHAVPTIEGIVRRAADTEREVYEQHKPRARKKAANE